MLYLKFQKKKVNNYLNSDNRDDHCSKDFGNGKSRLVELFANVTLHFINRNDTDCWKMNELMKALRDCCMYYVFIF